MDAGQDEIDFEHDNSRPGKNDDDTGGAGAAGTGLALEPMAPLGGSEPNSVAPARNSVVTLRWAFGCRIPGETSYLIPLVSNLLGIEEHPIGQYIGSLAKEARHATPKERNADHQDHC